MPAKIDVALLRKAVRAGPPARITRLLEKLEPIDLAPLLAELSPAELRKVIHSLMESHRLSDTLNQIPEDLLADVQQNLDDSTLARVLEHIEPDDATRLAHRIDEKRLYRVLDLTHRDRADLITRLMSYSPTSAGGRMTPQFVAVKPQTPIGDAIRKIKQVGNDASVFYLYVIDENNRLVGVTSLSQLVKTSDDTLVEEIMTTDLITLKPWADQEEVAQMVSQKHLLAVPIVGDANQLLGIVTIDDVIDVLQQEATEDMLEFPKRKRYWQRWH